MTYPSQKPLSAMRPPITQLVRLGKLEDILKSQASPEFKATCIEMGLEASTPRKRG